MKRVSKFLKEETCPTCHGSRINTRASSTILGGKNLTEVCSMSLKDLTLWLPQVIDALNDDVKEMGSTILEEFMINANALLSLGLGYLTLNRASSTLSTGELQRVQLARTVKNRTTGVLYVLDEPSIGLHPANVDGLISIMKELINDGNSIVLVDHDTRILKEADYMIEIGPEAGKNGGSIISQGTIDEIIQISILLLGLISMIYIKHLLEIRKKFLMKAFYDLKQIQFILSSLLIFLFLKGLLLQLRVCQEVVRQH